VLSSSCMGITTGTRCHSLSSCGREPIAHCDDRTEVCVCEPGACVDEVTGVCASRVDETVALRARAWRTSAEFPELSDGHLSKRTANIGLALAGDDGLSIAVAAGALRGLEALDALPHVRYISAGGMAGVAAALYTYAGVEHIPSDAELVGTFVPPEAVNASHIEDRDGSSIVAAASKDLWRAAELELQASLDGPTGAGAEDGGTLEEVWVRAVAKVFLQEAGLGSLYKPMGWDQAEQADFTARNPQVEGRRAHLPRPRRPFLVLVGALVGPSDNLPGLESANADGGPWPGWASNPAEWPALHLTSAYAGLPVAQSAVFAAPPPSADGPPAQDDVSILLGGYVENGAVGGGAALPGAQLPADRSAGIVEMPPPAYPLSLARAVAGVSMPLSVLLPMEAAHRAHLDTLMESQLYTEGTFRDTAAHAAGAVTQSGGTTATWLDVLVNAAPRVDYWSPEHVEGELRGGSLRGSGASPGDHSPPRLREAAEFVTGDAGGLVDGAIAALLVRGVREIVVPLTARVQLAVTANPSAPVIGDVDPQLPALFGVHLLPPAGTHGPGTGAGARLAAATAAVEASGGRPLPSALFASKHLSPVLDLLMGAKLYAKAAVARMELTTVSNARLGVVEGTRANVTFLYLDRNFEWERRLSVGNSSAARDLAAQVTAANGANAERECSHQHDSKPFCSMLAFPNLRGEDITAAPATHGAGAAYVDKSRSRYASLPDTRMRENLQTLALTFPALDRRVANAVASLVSFSVVTSGDLLKEALMHAGLPPREAAPLLSASPAPHTHLSRGRGEVLWVGCHTDDPSEPQLPFSRGMDLTTSLCAHLCDGYPYFGLHGTDAECRCGTDVRVSPDPPVLGERANYRKVADRECGQPCRGEVGMEPLRYCGARNRNAIYRLRLPQHPLASDEDSVARLLGPSKVLLDGANPLVLRPQTPVVVDVRFVACVPLQHGLWPLPYHRGVGHTTTSCAKLCHRFTLFSLSHARGYADCSCGDGLEHVDGDSSLEPIQRLGKCGDVCDGEEGAQPERFCGSRQFAAVYQMTGCHDNALWASPQGFTCSEYVARGWCATGKVLEPAMVGVEHDFPELNCCACGRNASNLLSDQWGLPLALADSGAGRRSTGATRESCTLVWPVATLCAAALAITAGARMLPQGRIQLGITWARAMLVGPRGCSTCSRRGTHAAGHRSRSDGGGSTDADHTTRMQLL